MNPEWYHKREERIEITARQLAVEVTDYMQRLGFQAGCGKDDCTPIRYADWTTLEQFIRKQVSEHLRLLL